MWEGVVGCMGLHCAVGASKVLTLKALDFQRDPIERLISLKATSSRRRT